MKKLDIITDMIAASHKLTIGLAGLVHEVLPEDEGYKVEVLLETYTDTLRDLTVAMKREGK